MKNAKICPQIVSKIEQFKVLTIDNCYYIIDFVADSDTQVSQTSGKWKSEMKKLKKDVDKEPWRMILYQSCVGWDETKRTLKNKQQCNPENSREYSEKQNLKAVKRG